MSDLDYRQAAINHPLVREGRFIEVAQEYIDACVRFPEDVFLRRRANAFLGELTRMYLGQKDLPTEGAACFWRFVEVAPAYCGQGDALGALDRGPRAPVVAAMADAAATLQQRACAWAEGLRHSRTEPRHLFLVTLPFSGVSAIAPILEDYLKSEGFRVVTDFNVLPGALAEADALGTRVFAWFHRPHEKVAPFLERPDIALVYLHRDPRDVIVSSMCVDQPGPAELFVAILGYRLDESFIDSVPYYRAIANADAAAWATTFPAMKADVAACARRILGMLDLEVDEERLRRLADAFSFQALAGRKEGEGSSFKRLGAFVVRKGTSGQWRERFDRTCALFFAAKYGHLPCG